MPDASLVRLLSWLSPAFPVGAFAYSHGVEQAINAGLVRDRAGLIDWLSALLERGSASNDAVLLAQAWRQASAGGDYTQIAELTEAMSGSRERHMETTLQGAAFGAAVAEWGVSGPLTAPYPIAVAVAAARHQIPLGDTLTAYLHAFTSNLVQASVRLVPLGQRDGVAALAALEPVILATVARASASTLDDLGSNTVTSDIMSMQHETLYSRVFRS
jgi:urease accessory protein